MQKKISIYLCIICLLTGLLLDLSPVNAQTVMGNSPDVFSNIDKYVISQISQYHIPGLALAIIQGDQIVYLRGYGVANPAGDAVTPQTSFITGSTGKSITATALMILVDQGKVDLDAPVQQYLPWFRLADADASRLITVQMLLNQTSGIPGGTGWAAQAYSDVSVGALENLVRSFHTARLNHVPGTTYEYANANYQIVGMIIQAVSGQSFQDFIQEHIYDPLDMTHSYTSREQARQHGMATGYRYWFGIPIPADNLPYSYGQFPAGWYISSVEDLAHYLILHMNNGQYGAKTLVSSNGMAELHRPELAGYAMGWVVDGNLISHNGGTPDFGTGFYFDTVTHFGVIVAFNANTGYFYSPAYVIAPSILRLMNGGQAIAPVPDAWYRSMLMGLSITLIVQSVWIFSSAVVIKRWRHDREMLPKHLAVKLVWLVAPLVIECGLAAYILSTFQANGRTVFTDFIYQPDIILLAVISLFLALGWGLLRSIISVRLLVKQPV